MIIPDKLKLEPSISNNINISELRIINRLIKRHVLSGNFLQIF